LIKKQKAQILPSKTTISLWIPTSLKFVVYDDNIVQNISIYNGLKENLSKYNTRGESVNNKKR